MAKFLIGVLTGVILAGLIAVIGLFAIVRLGERKPTVAADSTLILNLDGEIPERAPASIPLPFFEEREPMAVSDVWRILRRAETDPRVRAVVLMPGRVGIGWGKLQEIHECLTRFRRSGKPLVAFLRSPGAREYYLATAADRIYLPPEDMLNVKGLRAELMYFRKTLDKIGVQVEIEHAGKYKDFGDTFTRTSMSPETRQVLNSVLDDLYGGFLATVAAGRKKSPEQVRAIVDEGPFLARQALDQGLVDVLAYEDQMLDELKKRLPGGRVNKLACRNYLKAIGGEPEGGRRVALLTAQGSILSDSAGDLSDADAILSQDFNRLLRQAASDGSIRGVIVRIDSPGGSSFASDEIWREMNALSKKKPVVISMSDAAASGGYYIAMTGDPIVAYPGTFTGSIGVVFGKVNLRGLYDKLGISKDMLLRGRFADIDSDYGPLSEAARGKLREGIDDTYRSFVERVAEARKRKFAEIEPLAQGRLWLGSQAKGHGLVDELGGINRAIELIRKKANIPRDEMVTLVTYPPKKSIVDRLFSRTPMTSAESRLRALLEDLHAAALLEGGMLRLMPYSIQVR
jgi:protease-4